MVWFRLCELVKKLFCTCVSSNFEVVLVDVLVLGSFFVGRRKWQVEIDLEDEWACQTEVVVLDADRNSANKISRAKNDGQMKSRNDGMVSTHDDQRWRGRPGFKRSGRETKRRNQQHVLHTFPDRMSVDRPSFRWCARHLCGSNRI